WVPGFRKRSCSNITPPTNRGVSKNLQASRGVMRQHQLPRRSTCPEPSRYPYLRVSGIMIEATNPMATTPATYQKNQDSEPADWSHKATYSAVPPNSALAIA